MNSMDEKKPRILVIGDLFLDRYVYYDPVLSKSSLETGLMTITGIKEEYSPGAAGNVAKNLAMLDVEVIVLGPVGCDGRQYDLERELNKYGICTQFLIKSQSHVTPVYTKFINVNTGEEDLPRLDVPPTGLNETSRAEMMRAIELLVPTVDAVVVEDQADIPGRGCIDGEIICQLLDIRTRFRDKTFVADSRTKPEAFTGFLVKPNMNEFISSLKRMGILGHDESEIPDKILVQQYLSDFSRKVRSAVVVTAGEDGSFSFEYGVLNRVFSLEGQVRDVCGAGDAYIAALTIDYCSGESALLDSAKAATKAAALCVSQKGTGKLSRQALSEMTEPAYCEIDNPSIFRKSCRLPGNVKRALFDFDGTISLLREGWQPIMRDLMIRFITGKKKIEEELLSRIMVEVDEFIAETTGLQTILQMEGLRKLVIEYGFVPPNEILTPLKYKKIYTGYLKKIVKERINENVKSRYLLRGALGFLKTLRKGGITLLVASGTDKEDVIKETKYLGVHSYMNGGVFGALNSIEEYSKKKVIERLMKEEGIRPDELVVIGDGPVEITVGREAGAFTIGVASNEKAGFGWNKEKFQRLEKAGADVIIPDFSTGASLTKLIFKNKV
ncbi:PfkB family carbohydrate kinase [Mesotoga sp.]|uniref:PfkB family carbohydrate kinase n=1 Tax=Mesotoga sp. TaxID=2053577 RepID=UPI001BD5217C|nr:PfkB family carbohydrate kinase [Mesotoga sp.]